MTTQETTKSVVPRWERVGVALALLLAAWFRIWRLSQNDYDNTYYAAAVRSMLTGWRNFFFVSFDPAGFVTVDKPPVAFWVQTLSAKLFGYHGLSILLPQALAGVASVGLVWYLVRRAFGGGAGLLAAVAFAVAPISVAVDRSNNPDSLLTLTLLLAVCALVRATETGRLRPLLLCALLMGVAFNVKMLAGFVVLPTLLLVFLLASPLGWKRRIGHLAAATGVLVVTSLAWAVAVDLTPASLRPYVGSTQNNSEISLVIGYNGLERVAGGTGPGGPGGRRGGPFPGMGGPGGMPGGFPMPPGAMMGNGMPMPPPGMMAGTFPPLPGGFPGGGMPGGPPPFMGGRGGFPGRPGGPGGMFNTGTPGLLRFAGEGLAGQITWLFPLALIGLLAAATQRKWRLPLDRQGQALLLWGGWFGTYLLVFSFMRGIMHQYYVAILGPAMGALVGIGLVALWQDYRQGNWRSAALPITLALTAAWQAYVLRATPDWKGTLLPLLMLGTLAAVVGLFVGQALPASRRGGRLLTQGAVTVGVVAALLCPVAWSATPVLAKGNAMMPEAGPNLLSGRGRMPGPPDAAFGNSNKLLAFLQAHRRGERYLLATGGTHLAAPIIIRTGEPVMALGGFIGSDPTISLEGFKKLVAEGQVRYVLTSPMGMGPGSKNAAIFQWVRENGKAVDPALWREPEPNRADRNDLPQFAMAGNFPPPGGMPGGNGVPMAPGGTPGGFPGMPFGGRMDGRGAFMQLYDCAGITGGKGKK